MCGLPNSLSIAFTAAILLLVSTPSSAGPFGLEMGTSLVELQKVMKLKQESPHQYSVISLPNGHPAFNEYILVVTPEHGLCKISAYNFDIPTKTDFQRKRTSVPGIGYPVYFVSNFSYTAYPIPGTALSPKKLGKKVKVDSNDSCFVIMPFADPIGSYYQSIYQVAIEKAGMKPVRADTDIFATGKVIDQIWSGINAAKVLVAELTKRNPNVYYELGLAHALEKPVVLVSSNEEDVPFDLQHIRVIYHDVNDPFWGEKLIKKVAENILSAVNNPEEAIFKTRPRE